MSDKEPQTLVAAKNSSPLVVGLGDGENFVASDVTAILSETRKVIFVEEGELVTVTKDKVTITDFEGKPHDREPKTITWSAVQAEKGGFKHFMLKEIHEQPRAVADTLTGRVDLETDDVRLDGVEIDVAKVKRIVIIACGPCSPSASSCLRRCATSSRAARSSRCSRGAMACRRRTAFCSSAAVRSTRSRSKARSS